MAARQLVQRAYREGHYVSTVRGCQRAHYRVGCYGVRLRIARDSRARVSVKFNVGGILLAATAAQQGYSGSWTGETAGTVRDELVRAELLVASTICVRPKVNAAMNVGVARLCETLYCMCEYRRRLI